MRPENSRKLTLEDEKSNSTLLSSFFMMNERNEESLNSYGQISSKQISLYDKDMQIKYVIKGLKIRGC